MAEITISCPHCGTTAAVDEGYLGRTVKCNCCQNKFKIEQTTQFTPLEIPASTQEKPPQISRCQNCGDPLEQEPGYILEATFDEGGAVFIGPSQPNTIHFVGYKGGIDTIYDEYQENPIIYQNMLSGNISEKEIDTLILHFRVMYCATKKIRIGDVISWKLQPPSFQCSACSMKTNPHSAAADSTSTEMIVNCPNCNSKASIPKDKLSQLHQYRCNKCQSYFTDNSKSCASTAQGNTTTNSRANTVRTCLLFLVFVSLLWMARTFLLNQSGLSLASVISPLLAGMREREKQLRAKVLSI